MTKKEIETRLINLENAFLQSQKNNVKVTENADKAPVVENRVNNQAEEIKYNAESINISAETLDTVMEVVIPSQAESINEVTETLDTLMSTVIPELMGME